MQPAPYRGNKEVRGNFVLLRLHLKDLQKRGRRKEYDELVGTVQVSLFVRVSGKLYLIRNVLLL